MNIAIILAGGIGQRVGVNRPKQFIEVQNKPIIAYTLDVFQKHSEIDAIEVVCVDKWKDYLIEIISKYNFSKVKWIANGGATFQESVLNGVSYLENKINDTDIVMTHFAASPYVDEYIISDCIRVCKEKGNAISTTPFYLLSGYKDANGKSSSKWIDRESLCCMNSPHAFSYGLIKRIFDEAIETGIINEVEPHTTTLMQRMGYTVHFSKGTQRNMKITTIEDVEFFEKYMLSYKIKN